MLWVPAFDPAVPPPAELSLWARRLEISPVLASLLWRRGLRDLADMDFFLNPVLRRLSPLEQWPGVREAAALLARGLLSGGRLCVWGDYDVDGISATALVKDFLRLHGFACVHYIPARLAEGYGLNSQGLDRLAGEGVDLLLTVDVGISDVRAVAHAKELGMTVIVSDHHLPGVELPPADAIVNPRLADCPCPALAGVGVAFFLMGALNAALEQAGRKRADLRPLLDLVALGSLADVVDVNGQNRILIKNGLLKIAQGERVGIAALKAACGFAPGAALGAGQVVFGLAPRLNAAGRMGSAETALELLLTGDRDKAALLAEELSRLNDQRRREEEDILEEARLLARQEVEHGRMGLVLYSPSWHLGIIGIVASRLAESLRRPTVILADAGDRLKGSGRSVPGVDMNGLFGSCAPLLLGFGGHSMAAGLSLSPAALELFRLRFDDLVRGILGASPGEGQCRIDGELAFAQADFTFLKELEMLQPFGMGNREPVFVSPPVRVRAMRSRPGFLRLDLEDEDSGLRLRATAWREQAAMPASLKGRRIRIAYTPRIDRYNGAASVELRLKDWKEEEDGQ
ncbi:MAG: single-stranded-DNA-specific exonuclease RecJ [Desulfovibrio sp.]|jgi:single-stranded-DNA-specific exonuclease|nr:single-stranded-DNA-specific exonuclease RecJ [Desulfovibrio sp.]